MDKTVEIIVVAMIALSAAMILIFMVRGQSSGFLDFVNSQVSEAENSIGEQQDSDSEDGESITECPEGEKPARGGGCVPQDSSDGL